jgi:preprotein translocase subunit SecF
MEEEQSVDKNKSSILSDVKSKIPESIRKRSYAIAFAIVIIIILWFVFKSEKKCDDTDGLSIKTAFASPEKIPGKIFSKIKSVMSSENKTKKVSKKKSIDEDDEEQSKDENEIDDLIEYINKKQNENCKK